MSHVLPRPMTWWSAALAAIILSCPIPAGTEPAPVPAGTDAELPIQRALREMLRGRSFDGFYTATRQSILGAIAQQGRSAVDGLPAVLKDPSASPLEKFAALDALKDLDTDGRHAVEVLDLLVKGQLVLELRGPGPSSMPIGIGAYLARFIRKEADLQRLIEACNQKDPWVGVQAHDAIRRLPITLRAVYDLAALLKAENDPALRAAVRAADYDAGGEALRKALLNVARDASKPADIRLDAACAWAGHGSKADYDAALDLIKGLTAGDKALPYPVLQTLAALDWRRAAVEFTREFDAFKRKIPPRIYHDLLLLGTEAQVREIVPQVLDPLKQRGRVDTPTPEWIFLLDVGCRDAAPLLVAMVRAGSYLGNEIPRLRQVGGDPETLVRCYVDDALPYRAVALANSPDLLECLPVSLVRSFKADFVSKAELVLEGKHPRRFSGSTDSDGAQEQGIRFAAMLVLRRYAPEKAGNYSIPADRVDPRSLMCYPRALVDPWREPGLRRLEAEFSGRENLDHFGVFNLAEPYLALSGTDGVPFCRRIYETLGTPDKRIMMLKAMRPHDPDWVAGKLAGMLADEADECVRLDLAEALILTPIPLPEETKARVEKELVVAMRSGAGPDRTRRAMLLAVSGNAEGGAVFDAFLKGEGRPRQNFHLPFYDLARLALDGVEPRSGRARELLVRAVSGHPDPNVQAWAIRIAEGALRATGPGGRGFPLIDALVPTLGPDNDWRVRVAAAAALRLAFKDSLPAFDYDPWAAPAELRKTAAAVASWWAGSRKSFRWVPPESSLFGIGHFEAGP